MPSESSRGSRRSVRIGKYEVVSHIATGGMGAVYKALDTETGREVALKVLPPEFAANAKAVERFRREARNAAKLRHENIVTLYECGEANGTHYLALELIDGIDLYEYISRKGQLDAGEARTILRQALLGLEHAHRQGLVHRDIKPSNFLLQRNDDDLVVKLTDLGLARHESEDRTRVTTAGSTVGTVDYMSPEQARDSGNADIRSDLYSLGCTLYHMLTGKPPFSEGSMVERMYKHIEAVPPDVRQLNRQVPEGLAVILRRLLEKKPEHRYQSPSEALLDLDRMDSDGRPVTQRDVLAGLREEASEAPVARRQTRRQADRGAESDEAREKVRSVLPRRPPGAGPRVKLPLNTEALPDDETTTDAPGLSSQQLILAACAAITVAAVIGIVFIIQAGHKHAPQPEADNRPPAPPPVHIDTGKDSRQTSELRPQPPPPQPPPLLALYKPAEPVDAVALWQELEQPWANAPSPAASVPIVRVSRGYTAEKAPRFPTLAAACAARPADGPLVIEIEDNGPLFEAPLTLRDRDVVLRAAPGYRPLIVWDVQRSRERRHTAFLTLTRGSLRLENLDVVFKSTEPAAAEPVALFRVTDGDFLARRCTFSVASSASVTVLRLDGDKASNKCRLSGCLARGNQLVALDLQAPGSEALIDHSLLVSGDAPLVKFLARNSPRTTIRVARSTLVAGQTCLRGQQGAAEQEPALSWFGWDSLLARSHEQPGGELLALPEGASAHAVRWRAVNCLYAGWRHLLKGQTSITGEDWKSRRGLQPLEGHALAEHWPEFDRPELAERPPADYRIVPGSAVAYAATAEPGTSPVPLGCTFDDLPTAGDNWLARTYDRLPFPFLEVLKGETAPTIPDSGQGPYEGEVLYQDPGGDLGVYLQELAKTRKFGPRVVLRLVGSGEWLTSPIRLKDVHLVLSMEMPQGVTEPLVLAPRVKAAGGQEALVQVEDGNLDLLGGAIRFPNSDVAAASYLVKVKNGNLRIHGTRLYGPLTWLVDNYRGLIAFEGPGSESAAKARLCTLHEAVLVSGRAGLHLLGSGIQLRMEQCVVVAGSDALHIDPTAAARPRLNVQCSLEHNTIVAGQAAIRLEDAPHLARPSEPMLLQARANAFLVAFPETPKSPPPGMLQFTGQALARGLLLWQGDANIYDRRLHYYVLPASAKAPDHPQPYATWALTWGTPGDLQAILSIIHQRSINPAQPQLERLMLPVAPGIPKPPPGADFVRLGIVKK